MTSAPRGKFVGGCIALFLAARCQRNFPRRFDRPPRARQSDVTVDDSGWTDFRGPLRRNLPSAPATTPDGAAVLGFKRAARLLLLVTRNYRFCARGAWTLHRK